MTVLPRSRTAQPGEFDSKITAVARQHARSTRMGTPEGSGPDPAALLDDWQAQLRAEGCTEMTVVKWRRIVERGALVSGRTVTTTTSGDLAYWLATFSNANTRRTYWVAWRAWSTWLVQQGRRLDDPTRSLKRPKVPRGVPHPVSTPGVFRLLSLDADPRLRMMLLLAIFQGLRVSEIAAMSSRLIDVDTQQLRVVGKGGVVAELPLHPQVADHLEHMPATGWWFAHKWHPERHIVGVTVSNAIKDAMTAAGVPGVPHGLRHWFATALLREGANIRTVQTLMRHSFLATTEGYLDTTSEDRRDAILRLPTPVAPFDALAV